MLIDAVELKTVADVYQNINREEKPPFTNMHLQTQYTHTHIHNTSQTLYFLASSVLGICRIQESRRGLKEEE